MVYFKHQLSEAISPQVIDVSSCNTIDRSTALHMPFIGSF
jgi:hypothetical protein